jgi:hypothetical protein
MAYHFLKENFCLFTMIDKNRLFFFPLNGLYLAIVIYPNYYLLPPSTSDTPSSSLTLPLYRQIYHILLHGTAISSITTLQLSIVLFICQGNKSAVFSNR